MRTPPAQLSSINPNRNSSTGRQDTLGQLASINQELISRQQRFTSRDPGVLALIRERDALRRY